jgi:hypothetical protein
VAGPGLKAIGQARQARLPSLKERAERLANRDAKAARQALSVLPQTFLEQGSLRTCTLPLPSQPEQGGALLLTQKMPGVPSQGARKAFEYSSLRAARRRLATKQARTIGAAAQL